MLISAMMLLDISCSHRYNKGAPFTSKPLDLCLKYEINFHKLVVDYVIEERQDEQQSRDYSSYINGNAAKTIRKFSKEKKLKKISKSIKQINIDDEVQFANGKPIGFHKCVSDGIHLFHTKKINDKASELTEFTSENI